MRAFTYVFVAAAWLLCGSPLPAQAQEAKSDSTKETMAVAAKDSAGKDAAGRAAAMLNLNTATVEQLESLPGIGRRTAERILEQRQKSGGFKKIEDLMSVKGIGEKSFLKLKPMITVVKAEKPAGEV